MSGIDSYSLDNYGLDGIDLSSFTNFLTGSVSTVVSGTSISVTIPSPNFDPKMAILIMNEYNLVIAVNGSSFGMQNNYNTHVYNGNTATGWGARDFNKRFFLQDVIDNNQLMAGTYKYILLG
ncbi:hypothetical protein KQ941_02940 [Paenibacillus xylanexedens]|uniref:hypothetical protein n=1 Tax=Paenibacillus xylanexedens TaxID=528191 RepID=UPI001F21F9E5|nr:hypothetical protein [Paenibacillus xylanexedens]MCF7753385.1 hypothetical protein [Paenibacillus xylanexedens]